MTTFLLVTNRKLKRKRNSTKTEWSSDPEPNGMLSWLFVDSNSGELKSKPIRRKTMPPEFKKQLLIQSESSKKMLVFTPGARSYEKARDASIQISENLKSSKKAAFKGAVIGFSMAIQHIDLPKVRPNEKYFDLVEDQIEAGKSSYLNFLSQLQVLKNDDVLDAVFHFNQSAGTVLMQKAASIAPKKSIAIDHTVITGSPLSSKSFNGTKGVSTDIARLSKAVTVYWAHDDVVINFAEKHGTRGPAIGVRGPTDSNYNSSYASISFKNCQFVDCSKVNKFFNLDMCNHAAYEQEPKIYEDILSTMQGFSTPYRKTIKGSKGMGFVLT